ncbi:MAG: DUF5895 domain-containing protein [Cyanobacteria bacterium J06631_2]
MPQVTEHTPPYCQFIRGSTSRFGLGIDLLNAQKAGFRANPGWEETTHEFDSGNEGRIFLTRQPRMLVLNRSVTMMSDNGRDIYLYEREHCKGFKAFSYWIVWFVDEQNKPLSALPFRLKCSGYQGTSLIKLYDHPQEENTFCDRVIETYCSLAQNPQVNNKALLLAHAVYQPNLVRELRAPRSHPQHKSMTVQAKDFLIPTRENFSSLVIKGI